MAITPNTVFTAGEVLSASQQNNFPRGVMALATSTTTYTLTTSVAIATGMSVTFTAVANRNYRITYNEPQINTPTVSGFSYTQLRQTNAAGTQLQQALVQNSAAAAVNGTLPIIYVGTFTAGSVTLVGCAATSNTTGAPVATRSSVNPAQLIVEDIGTA
jgi:hypothetical protein